MKAFISSIFFLFIHNILIGQILHNQNGIVLEARLSATGKFTTCDESQKNDRYSTKKLQLWKIELILYNNTDKMVEVTRAPPAEIDVIGIKERNFAGDYCDFHVITNQETGFYFPHTDAMALHLAYTFIKIPAHRQKKCTKYIYLYEDDEPYIKAWQIGHYYFLDKKENKKKGTENSTPNKKIDSPKKGRQACPTVESHCIGGGRLSKSNSCSNGVMTKATSDCIDDPIKLFSAFQNHDGSWSSWYDDDTGSTGTKLTKSKTWHYCKGAKNVSVIGVFAKHWKHGCNLPILPGQKDPEDDKNNLTNTDDFWSGGPKKAKENQKIKEDDFWSAKSTNNGKKGNSESFWNGKGSKKEEEYFESQTKPEASNQFIGELESRTKTIIVKCRDHGAVDGDMVKILVNEKEVVSRVTLNDNYQTFKVNLKHGMNRVDFQALNEGTSSPNTAEFIVYDGNNKLISSKEWNILQGYTATLLIVRF